MPKPIHLLICDDHAAIISGLSALLKSFHVKIVGTVSDSRQILAEYQRCKPHVVLMDVRFAPNTPNGLEVSALLMRAHPQTRIVIYTQFDDNETIKEAYRLRCAAFITKNSDPALLRDAIERASEGKSYFLPAISERLVQLGLEDSNAPDAVLDVRELEMFKLMAIGASHAEISTRLNVSVRTVNTMSKKIKQRLGVEKPADITLLAVRHQLIQP